MSAPFIFDINICKNLRSERGAFALKVEFKSERKRIVLIGPSGAGKSLALKAMAGLLTPDQGYIRIGSDEFFNNGQNVNISPQKRNVGYLFQEYALFPHLNVRQNIAFGLNQSWFNPRMEQDISDVSHWLNVFNLGSVAKLYPSELSGGQRQRTALARTLAAKPKVLLLDEPFAALDTDLRVTMRKELIEVQKDLDIPMLLITHDSDDASMFGDEILMIKEGCIPVKSDR